MTTCSSGKGRQGCLEGKKEWQGLPQLIFRLKNLHFMSWCPKRKAAAASCKRRTGKEGGDFQGLKQWLNYKPSQRSAIPMGKSSRKLKPNIN